MKKITNEEKEKKFNWVNSSNQVNPSNIGFVS